MDTPISLEPEQKSNKEQVMRHGKMKNKRGAGCNKSRKKKREYKAHLHAQMIAGMAVNASGAWCTISASGMDSKGRDRAEKAAQRAGARSNG